MSRKAKWVRPDALPRLADFALLVALIVPLIFAVMKSVDFFQIRQCQPGSFQAGSLYKDYDRWGLLALTIALTYGARHCLFHLWPSLQKRLHETFRCTHRDHSLIGGLLSVTAIAGATALWITTFSQYCLNGNGIQHREKPWAEFQAHQWKDVTAIATGCRRGGRGHADAFYLLVMKDGTAVNIGDSLTKLEVARPQLEQQLRGQPFRFDASRVAADCPAPKANLLRTRP